MRRTGLVVGAVVAVGLGLAGPAAASSTDYDRDGMSNRYEVANGLNWMRADAGYDKDRDGLSNLTEYRLHTAANRQDTDGDGIDDADEVRVLHTSPLLRDQNGNGRLDGDDDADHDGVANEDEDDALETCAADDQDADHDGVANEDEDELTHGTVGRDADHDGVSDVRDADDDNDGVADVRDADADNDGTVDGNEDADHDGVANEDEDDSDDDRCAVGAEDSDDGADD